MGQCAMCVEKIKIDLALRACPDGQVVQGIVNASSLSLILPGSYTSWGMR